jgi:hypothetical protein
VLLIGLITGCGTEGKSVGDGSVASGRDAGSVAPSPSAEAKTPVVGDIDGDGDGDLVFEAADFMDLISDGSGLEMVSSSLSRGRPDAVCDFDGDHVADAIEQERAPKGQAEDTYRAVDAAGNTLATAKRERKVRGMYVNAVHCGDFDGDGSPDVGLAESTSELDVTDFGDAETKRVRFEVYRQVAPGRLGKRETWLDMETPRGESENSVFYSDFVVGDLNGDGKDDLTLRVDYSTKEFMAGGLGAMCGHLAAYSNGKAFRQGPVQKFVSKDRGGSSIEDAEIACSAIPADVDGDGAEELVGLDRAGKADVWSAKGGKWTRTKASTRQKHGGKDEDRKNVSMPTAATDVNGDGLTDLISITGSDTASVRLHAAQADGTLAPPKEILKLSMGESSYSMVNARLVPRR